MQNDTIYLYLSLLLAPISSAITWYVGRRRRKNEDIVTIQSTVNMLLERNHELTAEVLRLQKEVIKISTDMAKLRGLLTAEQLTEFDKTNNGTVQDFAKD